MKGVKVITTDSKNTSEKDEVAEQAAKSIRALAELAEFGKGKTPEAKMELVTTLNHFLNLVVFLIRQDKIRSKEYRLLLTSINEVKNELKEVKELGGENGFRRSKDTEDLQGRILGQDD